MTRRLARHRACAVALSMLAAGAAIEAQADRWVRHVSDAGRFTVQFPAQPTATTQQSKDADGKPLTQTLLTAEFGGEAYQVGYFDLAAGSTFSLEGARDGMIRNVNGTLVREERVTLFGLPAMNLWVTAAGSDKIEYLVRARSLLVGRRVYTIQAICPKATANTPAASDRAARFIDSFQAVATR